MRRQFLESGVCPKYRGKESDPGADTLSGKDLAKAPDMSYRSSLPFEAARRDRHFLKLSQVVARVLRGHGCQQFPELSLFGQARISRRFQGIGTECAPHASTAGVGIECRGPPVIAEVSADGIIGDDPFDRAYDFLIKH